MTVPPLCAVHRWVVLSVQLSITTDEPVAGNALPRALELAHLIAAKAPLAARQIKSVVRNRLDAPLDAGLRLERRGY